MTINVKVKHPFAIYDKDIAVYAYNTHSGIFNYLNRLAPDQEMEFCIYDTQSIVLVELHHDLAPINLNKQ